MSDPFYIRRDEPLDRLSEEMNRLAVGDIHVCQPIIEPDNVEGGELEGWGERKTFQVTDWRQSLFVAVEDGYVLRRGLLLYNAASNRDRDAGSYCTVRVGIAQEGSTRIEYVGDGYDGSTLTLRTGSAVRLTGEADTAVAVQKGECVVFVVERNGLPDPLTGMSVQIAVGPRSV